MLLKQRISSILSTCKNDLNSFLPSLLVFFQSSPFYESPHSQINLNTSSKSIAQQTSFQKTFIKIFKTFKMM